jgi:hypothetical protein
MVSFTPLALDPREMSTRCSLYKDWADIRAGMDARGREKYLAAMRNQTPVVQSVAQSL